VEEAEARREVEGVCSRPLRERMFAVLESSQVRTNSELGARRLHLHHALAVCLVAPCFLLLTQLMLCWLYKYACTTKPLPHKF